MRKILAVLTVLLVVSTSYAEDKAPTKSTAKGGRFAQVYINPIGAAFGLLDVGADIVVAGNFAMGPVLVSLNAKSNQIFYEVKTQAIGFGLRMNYQFNNSAIGSGWVLNGTYIYFPSYKMTAKEELITITNSEFTRESSEYIADLTFGYRWLWWNHMSLKVSAGARYNSLPKRVTLTGSNNSTLETDSPSRQSGINPGGDLMLGYAF